MEEVPDEIDVLNQLRQMIKDLHKREKFVLYYEDLETETNAIIAASLELVSGLLSNALQHEIQKVLHNCYGALLRFAARQYRLASEQGNKAVKEWQLMQHTLDQAATDMPQMNLLSASVYQRKEECAEDLAVEAKPCYVEIAQEHVPIALYRAWISGEGPKAVQIAILKDLPFENDGHA